MIRDPKKIQEGEKKIRMLIAGYPGIGKSTLALSAPNVPTDVPQIVPTEKELETRDRVQSLDTDKEARDKSTDIVCAEPQSSSAPPIASLVLNDGTYFHVSADDFNKWVALYPAVDVMQELRKMVGWCDANLNRRKTKRGIRAFVTSWLAKEQDKGGRYRGGNAPRDCGSGNIFADIMEGNGYESK